MRSTAHGFTGESGDRSCYHKIANNSQKSAYYAGMVFCSLQQQGFFIFLPGQGILIFRCNFVPLRGMNDRPTSVYRRGADDGLYLGPLMALAVVLTGATAYVAWLALPAIAALVAVPALVYVRLRRSYRVYMLSNTNPIMWKSKIRDDFGQQGLTREDYFDGIVTSFEAKALKPDRAIFDYACRKLGIRPDRNALHRRFAGQSRRGRSTRLPHRPGSTAHGIHTGHHSDSRS